MPERTRESQELETDRVGFRLGTEKKTGDIGDYGTVHCPSKETESTKHGFQVSIDGHNVHWTT